MPYKKYRKYRRRPRRKKGTYGNARKFTKTYNRNFHNKVARKAVIEPFPSTIKVRQNWASVADVIQQSAGPPSTLNTLVINSILKLSSAKDPSFQPGNQEAVQYHNLYSRYYGVYQATYAIVKLNLRNTGPLDCRVVAGIADNSAAVANMQTAGVNIEEMEMQKYTQSRVLENGNGSKFNRATMTFKFNVSKWSKRNNIDPENTSSSVLSDPGEYPILYIGIINDNAPAAAAAAQITVDTKMIMWTKYSERKQEAIMKTT